MDTFDCSDQMQSLIGYEHLKSQSCEIKCFCYFRSKIITTKNGSNIIINRANSLFVINIKCPITTLANILNKKNGISPFVLYNNIAILKNQEKINIDFKKVLYAPNFLFTISLTNLKSALPFNLAFASFIILPISFLPSGFISSKILFISASTSSSDNCSGK